MMAKWPSAIRATAGSATRATRRAASSGHPSSGPHPRSIGAPSWPPADAGRRPAGPVRGPRRGRSRRGRDARAGHGGVRGRRGRDPDPERLDRPVTHAAIIDCDPGHDDVSAILMAGRLLDVVGHHDGPRQCLAGTHDDQRPQDRRVRRPDPHPDRGRHACPSSVNRTTRPMSTGRPGWMARTCRRRRWPSSTSMRSTRSCACPTRSRTSTSCRSDRDQHRLGAHPRSRPAGADRRITLMGGSLTFGNVTPSAEFNIWCDPEAAHVVFRSGIRSG